MFKLNVCIKHKQVIIVTFFCSSIIFLSFELFFFSNNFLFRCLFKIQLNFTALFVKNVKKGVKNHSVLQRHETLRQSKD